MSRSRTTTRGSKLAAAIAKTSKAQRARHLAAGTGQMEPVEVDSTPSISELRAEYLTLVCGYVPRDRESLAEAFKRLRRDRPELFPVPREGQSMLEAMHEAVQRVRGF